MLHAGLWIPHGKTYEGRAIYSPKLVGDGALIDIYGDGCDSSGPTLHEVANMGALERIAGRNARRDNASLIRDFDYYILW